jgi:anti-sigma regulatory factor (Ser/Thr protein kinase)
MSRTFVVVEDTDAPTPSPLNDSLSRIEMQFTLANDISLIYVLVTYLRDRLAAFGMCDATHVIRVGIALEEALLNALYHGNLELTSEQLQQASDELLANGHTQSIARRQKTSPYRQRRIHVRAELSRTAAEFVIRDEGPGFDTAAHLPMVIDDEPKRPTGRGLELMHAFMDEVRFNERGNEVRLVKLGHAA